MVFVMTILGFLIFLTVESKATINKLFFLGPNVDIICPIDGSFYQWKKYQNQKMTNIFQEDKKKLNISLRLKDSPSNYECGVTSGFDKRNVNITVYIFDRYSKKAQDLCYRKPIKINSAFKPHADYPCFLNYPIPIEDKIVKGSSVTFNCEADGRNITYKWFKLNPITNDKELLKLYGNLSILDVHNADEKSIGQYLCIAYESSGRKLQRYFQLYISEESLRANPTISVEEPEIINISANMNKTQRLDCSTKVSLKNKIQAVQWGKKMNTIPSTLEKQHVILWEGGSYKLLPESQVIDNIISDSKIVSSLLLKDIMSDTKGEYICVIVTNSGSVNYKTFHVNVSANETNGEIKNNFFFLYILIPSLIIAFCLFIGAYLTINRRPGRKLSNFIAAPKLENDASMLRTTPDYASVQYQSKTASNDLHNTINQNFYKPYYPSVDKLLI